MKISVLEKNVLTIGDISFSGFDKLGKTDFYDRLSNDEIIDKCGKSEVIVCNKTLFGEELFSKLPRLKLICLTATGFDNIDTAAAKRHNITVCNVPGYSTESVVQTVFSLMLNLAGKTYRYIESVRNGEWISSETFTYFSFPLCELNGKTLGIIGYGTIGKRVAQIGEAFGMNILINSRTKKSDCVYEQATVDEMLPKCDFLSLNCRLTPQTRHIINAETLKLMKKSAFIINTSRGGTVDEVAVADALRSGRLAGFGADVIDSEPMRSDCPLYGIENVILTPHIAWATKEARTRLVKICINNIEKYIDGNPINTVTD